MNTLRTDHRALEIDNREGYRKMLIASQQQSRTPYHYDFHGVSTSLTDVLGLTIFAGGMLALIGYGLMWMLG